jgi:hypothetical protein
LADPKRLVDAKRAAWTRSAAIGQSAEAAAQSDSSADGWCCEVSALPTHHPKPPFQAIKLVINSPNTSYFLCGLRRPTKESCKDLLVWLFIWWELKMDNGAYEKYRRENPIVNTLTTTYEHITMFPEQLTNVEIILLITLPLIALYAVVRLIYQLFFKKKDWCWTSDFGGCFSKNTKPKAPSTVSL